MNTIVTEEQTIYLNRLLDWMRTEKDLPDIIMESKEYCMLVVHRVFINEQYSDGERKQLNVIIKEYNKSNGH